MFEDAEHQPNFEQLETVNNGSSWEKAPVVKSNGSNELQPQQVEVGARVNPRLRRVGFLKTQPGLKMGKIRMTKISLGTGPRTEEGKGKRKRMRFNRFLSAIPTLLVNNLRLFLPFIFFKFMILQYFVLDS